MPNLTTNSEPSEVFSFLRPILQPIYEALEAAVPAALQLIEERGWERTTSLSSHLVRAETKFILQGRQCPVVYDDASRTVVMNAVGNEGLATNFDRITLRIWKGSTLPVAQSQARQSFYQHHFPYGLWSSGVPLPIQSLVILWDCHSDGGGLRVWLCCPNGQTGRYEWMQEIKHPSEWMIVSERHADVSDDLDDLLKDDNVKTGETDS